MAEHEGPPDPLSGPQRKAIAALLAGATNPQAAKRAGVDRRTVWLWLQDDTFKAELRAAEQYQFREIAGKLASAGAEAVDTLVTLMREPQAPAIRLKAATEVLTKVMRAHELTAVDETVDAMAERLASVSEALKGKG